MSLGELTKAHTHTYTHTRKHAYRDTHISTQAHPHVHSYTLTLIQRHSHLYKSTQTCTLAQIWQKEIDCSKIKAWQLQQRGFKSSYRLSLHLGQSNSRWEINKISSEQLSHSRFFLPVEFFLQNKTKLQKPSQKFLSWNFNAFKKFHQQNGIA